MQYVLILESLDDFLKKEDAMYVKYVVAEGRVLIGEFCASALNPDEFEELKTIFPDAVVDVLLVDGKFIEVSIRELEPLYVCEPCEEPSGIPTT